MCPIPHVPLENAFHLETDLHWFLQIVNYIVEHHFLCIFEPFVVVFFENNGHDFLQCSFVDLVNVESFCIVIEYQKDSVGENLSKN